MRVAFLVAVIVVAGAAIRFLRRKQQMPEIEGSVWLDKELATHRRRMKCERDALYLRSVK